MKKLAVALLLLNIFTVRSQISYKYGKVSEEEIKETSCSLESSAPASILYNERYTTFEYSSEDGFYIVDEYFMRLKIYSKEGYKYATKRIPLYYSSSFAKQEVSGIKANTYTLENGKIVKTKLENSAIFLEKTNKYWNQTKFTMPNLQEGAVIEWTYKIKSPFISKLKEVVLQSEIPILKSSITINIPEYMVYNTITKGYLNIPIKKERKDRTLDLSYMQRTTDARGFVTGKPERVSQSVTFTENIYKIDMVNVPSLKEEALAGNIENYTLGILFELSFTKYPGKNIETYTSDWEAVVKTIYDSESFGDQMKDNKYVDVLPVIEGKTTDLDKIDAIFKHIKSKIKWNNFISFYTDEGVKKAYKNGLGNVADINLNLVNILRSAGFDANPVLVSTVDNGIPLFPSRDAFDYVVAVVNVNNEKILLDASNSFTTFNILPEVALNFNGREVKPNGKSDWIELHPKKHSVSKTITNIKFNENGFEGNSRNIKNNHFALNYREEMTGKAKEAIIEMLNNEYNDIDVLDVRINFLEDLDKETNEFIKFETDAFYEEISGKTYIAPMFYNQTKTNPFKSEKRDFPIFFNKPWVENITTNLTIPENYLVVSLPENTEIILPNNLGGFAYKLVQNGQIVQIDSSININEPVIQTSDYQIIKDFYQNIIVKQKEKIVIKKQ